VLRVLSAQIAEICTAIRTFEAMCARLEPYMDTELPEDDTAPPTPYEEFSSELQSLDYYGMTVLGHCEEAMKYAALALKADGADAQ